MNSYIHILLIYDEPIRYEVAALVHEAVRQLVSDLLQTHLHRLLLLFSPLPISHLSFTFASFLLELVDHQKMGPFFQR